MKTNGDSTPMDNDQPSRGRRQELIVPTLRLEKKAILIELTYQQAQRILGDMRTALADIDSDPASGIAINAVFRRPESPLSAAALNVTSITPVAGNQAVVNSLALEIQQTPEVADALVERIATDLQTIDDYRIPSGVYTGVLITLEKTRIVTDVLIGGVPLEALEIDCLLNMFTEPLRAIYIGNGEFLLHKQDGTRMPGWDVVFRFEPHSSGRIRHGLYHKVHKRWLNVGEHDHQPGLTPADCAGELSCGTEWFEEYVSTQEQVVLQLSQLMMSVHDPRVKIVALTSDQPVDLGDGKIVRAPTAEETAKGYGDCLVVEIPLPPESPPAEGVPYGDKRAPSA